MSTDTHPADVATRPEHTAPAPPWWAVNARLLAAMVLGIVGVVMIFAGWWGASGTTYVPSQLAYLASGSVGGIGALVLGCLLYWSHQRAEEAALFHRLDRSLTALADLADGLVQVLDDTTEDEEPAS